MMLCLSSLLFLSGLVLRADVAHYYARDVLGNGNYSSLSPSCRPWGDFVAALLVPYLVGTIGKKRAYIASGAVAAAGGLGVAFAPASIPGDPHFFFAVFGLGLGVVSTLLWALESDTVEYGEWKSGVRAEGAIYSVFSFPEVGQAVGGATAAYVIGLGGYVADAEQQAELGDQCHQVRPGVVPSVFILLAIAVMVAYPLSEAKVPSDRAGDRRSAGADSVHHESERTGWSSEDEAPEH